MFSNGEVKGEYIIYVIKGSYQVSYDHRSCEHNCVRIMITGPFMLPVPSLCTDALGNNIISFFPFKL